MYHNDTEAAMKPKKTTGSQEWYTPPEVLECVFDTFGGPPELDPASCAQANEHVKAQRIFTKHEDGLSQLWKARSVFVNPPGGNGSVARWWDKAVNEYRSGRAFAVIFVLFDINKLQTLQNNTCGFSPLVYDFCIPKKRVAYMRSDGSGRLVRGPQPLDASTIVYLGQSPISFEDAFSRLGGVVRHEEG